MCGVVGIYAASEVNQDLYDAVMMLQHRGQDAAGMATFNGKVHMVKDKGMVAEIFSEKDMARLKGEIGVGHTRYSTVGGLAAEDSQPFYVTSPYGIVLAHNGNLVNVHELKKELMEKDKRLVNSDCDAEVILQVFSSALSEEKLGNEVTPEQIYRAVKKVYSRCVGGYSVVGFIANHGFFAFRDPHGIRPLLFATREKKGKTEYMFASENVAMDILGFQVQRSVGPGEVIFIDSKRKLHMKEVEKKESAPSIFEYIYFSRPDTMIDNISVYKSRLRLGQKLAQRIMESGEKLDIDAVIPVPDSARTAALALAQEMNLPYREGLVKNRYIGRTFIMPGQSGRKKSIRYKLNAMSLEIKGKNVLLVDDSIVRGNTSRKIIQLVRDAGAKKVYFASYSSPVISPDFYGIDIPSKKELIACGLTIPEICKSIGADKLFYQSLEDMIDAVRGEKFKNQNFDASCFDGKYIVGDINAEFLEKYEKQRENDRIGCVSKDNLSLLL